MSRIRRHNFHALVTFINLKKKKKNGLKTNNNIRHFLNYTKLSVHQLAQIYVIQVLTTFLMSLGQEIYIIKTHMLTSLLCIHRTAQFLGHFSSLSLVYLSYFYNMAMHGLYFVLTNPIVSAMYLSFQLSYLLQRRS